MNYRTLTPAQREIVDISVLRILEVDGRLQRADRLVELQDSYAKRMRDWWPKLPDDEVTAYTANYIKAVVCRFREIVAAGGDKGGTA